MLNFSIYQSGINFKCPIIKTVRSPPNNNRLNAILYENSAFVCPNSFAWQPNPARASQMQNSCPNSIDKGMLRCYVPTKQTLHEPIMGVKGFNGRFE